MSPGTSQGHANAHAALVSIGFKFKFKFKFKFRARLLARLNKKIKNNKRHQMPPKQSMQPKRAPADESRRAPKDQPKPAVAKDKRERSSSSLSTQTVWHGIGANAWKPGF
jgi:hypothetical protein